MKYCNQIQFQVVQPSASKLQQILNTRKLSIDKIVSNKANSNKIAKDIAFCQGETHGFLFTQDHAHLGFTRYGLENALAKNRAESLEKLSIC